MTMSTIVNCPTCGTKVEWTEAFLIGRFARIDANKLTWRLATERFSIAGEPCLDPSKLGEEESKAILVFLKSPH